VRYIERGFDVGEVGNVGEVGEVTRLRDFLDYNSVSLRI
jgi:hypothetical protein